MGGCQLDSQRRLIVKNRSELNRHEVKALMELLILVWPPQHEVVDMKKMIRAYEEKPPSSFHKVLLYYMNEELVGHTEIFDREIFLETERITHLALAGVCVKPEFRGQKIGLEMAQKAFGFVDNGRFPFSIFQTNVPEFYDRLDCRQINHRFINSQDSLNPQANPWRDPYVMLYPKMYLLGNETIDLNGDCY